MSPGRGAAHVACAALVAVLADAAVAPAVLPARGVAAQAPAAASPRLALPPLGAVIARRDSFVASTPAGPVGWMRIVVLKAPDGGLTITETIVIEDDLELVTATSLTPRLGVRRLRQAGSADGQVRLADLVRRGDRLQGTVIAAGGAVVPVDEPAPDAPDVVALTALVPAMSLARDAQGRFEVVVPGRPGTDTAEVVVEGREPASDGSGDAAGWRVRLTRGGSVTHLVISDSLPRRVLSARTDGQPWRFVRPRPAGDR